MHEKRPLVISGPSGIGKTTLSNQLELHGFRNVLKTTTRQARVNEIDGVDYEFTDEENFLAGVRNNEFIMDDHFYNNYYGIRKSEFSQVHAQGNIPMLQIHTPTVERFLTYYPYAETVFLKSISFNFLANRLKTRTQNNEEYAYRFNQGVQELEDYESTYRKLYKHEFVIYSNDNAEHIEKIKTIYERPRGTDKLQHI